MLHIVIPWRLHLLYVKALLHFFVDKVTSIRAQILPSVHDPLLFVPCSAVFHSFETVTLKSLQEVVSHLKKTVSPDDAIPPRLFHEVFLAICSSVLALVNSSLSSEKCVAKEKKSYHHRRKHYNH